MPLFFYDFSRIRFARSVGEALVRRQRVSMEDMDGYEDGDTLRLYSRPGALYGQTTSLLAGRAIVADGEIVVTSGYATAGDGGGAIFRAALGVSAGADGNTKINASNGQWRIVYTGPINVRWFGATPTAARINAAINYAVTLGGGEVRVPRDAYTITGMGTDRIVLKSNITLVFEPGCTITTGAITGTSIVIYIDASTSAGLENVTVQGNGLRITGNKAAGVTHAQWLVMNNYQPPATFFRNVRISDIICENAGYDGILSNGNVGILPENVIFERITCTGCGRVGGAEIHAAGVKYFDCEFLNSSGHSPEYGFDIEIGDAPSGASTNRGGEFVRCKFAGNVSSGIAIQGFTFGITTGYRFTDCSAYDNGGSGFGNSAHDTQFLRCRAYRNAQHGFYADPDTVFTDCWAYDNVQDGFRLQISGSRITASGIVSEFNGGNGILLNSLGNTRGVTNIVGATVRGNFTVGVYFSGAVNAKLIDSVVELNKEEGVRFRTSSHCSVADTTIAQNGCSADASRDNVYVDQDCAHNAILNNTIRQCMSYYRGNAVGAGSTEAVVQLAAHASKRSSSEYVHSWMRILSGTESGADEWVDAYDDTTQTIDLAADLPGPPDNTSVIELVAGFLTKQTVASATSSTVVRFHDDNASARNNAYHGTAICVQGTGVGQRRDITGYTGSTRSLTVSPAWLPVLDDTSVLIIVVKNRPRYGIRIDATGYYTLVRDNDAYYAGTTGQISDAGTGTDSAGNRTT